jgi:hypothetical protein
VPPTTSLSAGMANAGKPRTPGTPYNIAQTRKLPGGPLPAGRPPRVGNYVISPNPDMPSGFDMLNDQPDLIEQVHENFLKAYRLPPSLTPSRLRAGVGEPEVMKKNRGRKISRGFVYQKSLRA